MTTTTANRGARRRGNLFSRLYVGNGALDIVGRRRTWYIAFGLLVLVCLASIVFRGFNLGIDFTGGTQIQFPATGTSARPTSNRSVWSTSGWSAPSRPPCRSPVPVGPRRC